MPTTFFTDSDDQPRAVMVSFAIVKRGVLPGMDDRDVVVVLATGVPTGHFNMCDGGVSERHLLNSLLQGPYLKGIRLDSIVFFWADELSFYHWHFTPMIRGWWRWRSQRVVRAGVPFLEAYNVRLMPVPVGWTCVLSRYFANHAMDLTN